MKRFILAVLCASQVSFGMQPDQPDKNDLKREELLFAIEGCDLPRVKQLLAEGVNPNGYDSSRKSPLARAVRRDCFEVCQALLDAGADVNWVSKDEKDTPLHMYRFNSNILKLLLAAGADVNASDDREVTVLLELCRWCFYEDVNSGEQGVRDIELLLQYGADYEHVNKWGERAIDGARERLLEYPSFKDYLGRIIALLSDPKKIRDVILRDDNPCLEMKPWRKTDKNIFNALMGREMGGK